MTATFIFRIKDNRLAIDGALLRALFSLAAIASLIYQSGNLFYINLSVAIFLIALALYINTILVRFKIKPLLLVAFAAVLFFTATHSLFFAIILLFAGLLPGFIYKAPLAEIGEEKITIKRMIGSSTYEWQDFYNIILKDSLLTLDFKNNRLLQLEIENAGNIDETTFNQFCREHLRI